MKKWIIILLGLCCILLAGCGREKSGEAWQGVTPGMDLTQLTERTEYYDIVSESEELFNISPVSQNEDEQVTQKFLGMQFNNGEPVQIWEEVHAKNYAFLYTDVYLYMADGSRKLLLQNSDYYRNDPMFYDYHFSAIDYHWYIDQEGNYYYWRRCYEKETQNESLFVKLDASGNELYRTGWEYGVDVYDILQLPDGRIYLFLNDWYCDGNQYTYEGGQFYYGNKTLNELNPATGAVSEVDSVDLTNYLGASQFFGAGEKGLVSLVDHSNTEVEEIDIATGNASLILSSTGTSYRLGIGMNASMSLQDLRLLEDGSVELLWADPNADGAKGIYEKLQMEKVERIPIVLCGLFGSDKRITERVCLFNQTNKTYHVIIEDCGEENDTEDFARLISIQIATGGGPDILCGNVLQDYIVGMIEKGAFEDLTPYMADSGIREDEYFPAAFSSWRYHDKIYGVNPSMFSITGTRMNGNVLGGRREPDIESLIDALIDWDGDAVYLADADSQNLLEEFLQGTDNLWGMVDWENGSCDFSGELFAKILEVAASYGKKQGDGRNSCIAERRSLYSLYFFDSLAEQENTGNVTSGILFDDGCHAVVSSERTMAINSNSRNKEGAWEFICFLLGDEAQLLEGVPVGRKAFETWMETELERVADGKIVGLLTLSIVDGDVVLTERVYTQEDVTPERVAEYIDALEGARTLPIHTAPILDIIYEEAGFYFYEGRSIEDVCKVITNRVQLYLDEHR